MTSIFGMTRPPVGFGPGSQPEAEEEGLAYLPMPSGMRTYDHHLPRPTELALTVSARTLLEQVRAGLETWILGSELRIAVERLDAPALGLIDEALGEGEVAVLVERAGDRLEIQEAALAGVWRVRSFEDGTAPPRETVLIGAFPRVALNRAFPAAETRPTLPATPPPGLMNGLPILAELLDRSSQWKRGDAAHAVNFSLLPHTPEDLAFIESQLGTGATTILSRGYGNCRVTATAVPNVWWVRYYNSVDTLILNTVEICDVPLVVCASAEDIADSAERLCEILDAIGGGERS